MTLDQLHDESDKWAELKYRMENEGIEYCFKHYSDFSEIENDEFHSKRKNLIDIMVDMENYVQNQISQIEDKIIEKEDMNLD